MTKEVMQPMKVSGYNIIFCLLEKKKKKSPNFFFSLRRLKRTKSQHLRWRIIKIIHYCDVRNSNNRKISNKEERLRADECNFHIKTDHVDAFALEPYKIHSFSE